MDPIEITYDSMDAVPEAFRPLFEEQDGKAVLTRVNGLKSQKDVDNLSSALQKERNDHKSVRDALKAWGDLKPDEVRSQLDRIPVLEASQGQIDDDKLAKLLEPKVAQIKGPLDRQINTLSEENKGLKENLETLQNQIQTRDRNDAVRSKATEMKVQPTAVPDIEMAASMYLERTEDGKFITKSGIDGITPGLDVGSWLREMQKSRPHWWPASSGGGANGATGIAGINDNPWSAGSWNMTRQANIYREHGKDVAERLAKLAGTSLGGPKPAEK